MTLHFISLFLLLLDVISIIYFYVKKIEYGGLDGHLLGNTAIATSFYNIVLIFQMSLTINFFLKLDKEQASPTEEAVVPNEEVDRVNTSRSNDLL